MTILMALCSWVANKFHLEESLQEVGIEVLQKSLWTPLKEKIMGFFDTEDDAEHFLESISTQEIDNIEDPSDDIAKIYEEINPNISSEQLYSVLIDFIKVNTELIHKINSENNKNEVRITKFTDSQKAKTILNIGKVDQISL